jgi:hypothetical protein
MAAFQPVGEVARWRTLYAHLSLLTVGDLVTYEQLAELLDLDPDEDRHVLQMAMRRAAKEFEEVDQHAVAVEPNVGYRVVPAPEHLDLAKKQQKRAGKALQRGHSKVVNVDLTEVAPELRNAFRVVAQAFALQMDMNRRFDMRQKKLEEAVGSVTKQQERSDSEIAELRDRLESLERSRSEEPKKQPDDDEDGDDAKQDVEH